MKNHLVNRKKHPPFLFIISVLLCQLATVTQAEERIISTNPGITELLNIFDQAKHVVGADSLSKKQLVNKQIANIGYHRQLSTEGLLSLKPTKIIGTTEMGPKSTLIKLKEMGAQVIILKNANSIKELKDNITTLGDVFKNKTTTDSLNEKLEHIEKQLKKHAVKRSCVFLLNIGGHNMRLAGKSTTGDAYINLLGAQNLVTFNNYREASSESLFSLNPECILLAGSNPNTAIQELINRHKKLSLLPAIRKNRIYAVESKHLIAGISLEAINEAIKTAQKLNNDK